ncbi:MAG: uracil-DNA glycosylase [Desulfurococcales archaeon ex4484_58]|nr:MAG: uracil-DNA glycosylase [Desulfurococcales archaeon ex4484_58]
MSDGEWDKLIEEILNCRKCELYKYRRNPVPGEGRRDADIMFVGEAPGSREDETGKPFVGAAGKLLTELIEGILGLKREEVYITNIVKCRPPNNRDPKEEEIKRCSPYLVRQIKLIKPKIIVALGRHSAKFLFEEAGLKWRNMSIMHGKIIETILYGINVKLMATYHPAAALYYPKLRPKLEKDFNMLKKTLLSLDRSREKRKTLFDYL